MSTSALPRSTLEKLLRRHVPEGTRVDRATTEMVSLCCTEFISLVTSEANELMAKEGTKMLSAAHVAAALRSLELDEYSDDVAKLAKQAARPKKRKFGDAESMSSEELARSQAALFKKK